MKFGKKGKKVNLLKDKVLKELPRSGKGSRGVSYIAYMPY